MSSRRSFFLCFLQYFEFNPNQAYFSLAELWMSLGYARSSEGSSSAELKYPQFLSGAALAENGRQHSRPALVSEPTPAEPERPLKPHKRIFSQVIAMKDHRHLIS